MTDPLVPPYTASYEKLVEEIDRYVEFVFGQLESGFSLILPKGSGYVEYPRFQEAYQTLYNLTNGFQEFTTEKVMQAWSKDALSFVVVRTILGFTPPEFADAAYQSTGLDVGLRSFARYLDREVRINPRRIANMRPGTKGYKRVQAMAETACKLISQGPPPLPGDVIHRLDKIDTKEGLVSVRVVAQKGVAYPMLLYERFLGRPFASHRDAVSELVGDLMENAVAKLLEEHRIPFRRTARAERIPGFDQAPDFIVPDEGNPKVVIEAKIAGDDGTARDKVARILRLAENRDKRLRETGKTYQLVACIDGLGFGVRRQDMRNLLIATKGKVFTTKTLPDLIEYTDLHLLRPSSSS
jgi:hypothetical protein